MSRKRVYLCGPICKVDLADAKLWRDRAITLLTEKLFTIVNPLDYFDPDPKKLAELDFGAIDSCDIVLAYMPEGVQAVGSAMEMYHAAKIRKIPVVVWGSYLGNVPYFLTAFAAENVVYSDLYSAVLAVTRIAGV